MDGPATQLIPDEPSTMQTIAGVMGNVLECDVIAENFFAPSVAAEMEMQDDLGFSSEIVAE
eukprot:scaffold206501_cov36-Cyclotella_meneghiniana.AAC.1